MVPGFLLLEEAQPLLPGGQQLVLTVDLLLLPERHGSQLSQRQLHAARQLKPTKQYIKISLTMPSNRETVVNSQRQIVLYTKLSRTVSKRR